MKKGKWLDCGKWFIRRRRNPHKVAISVIVFGTWNSETAAKRIPRGEPITEIAK